VIFAANLLRIPFYLGYKRFIMNIVVFSAMADRVIWASSMSLFLISFIIQYFRGEFNWRGILPLSLFYGMLILMGIEIASFSRWVYNLFFPSPVFANESWHIAFTETQITNILYPILPAILMFFSYSWIGEFTFKGLLTKKEESKKENANNAYLHYFNSSKISIIIIASSVIAALFIGHYNHAAAAPHNQAFPGVDVPHYVRKLEYMLNSTSIEALSYASKDDRFLYLVLQYLCFLVTGSSPKSFVAYSMPIVLTFLFMLSTFFLVKVGRNLLHAATAMLVTVFSFQVTVGIYAGFFANWFALTFVYIFYGLLMIVMKGHRHPSLLLLAGLTSAAVLYVHPWTWILLVMMILAAYIVTTLMLVWIRKADLHSYIWELKFLAALFAVNVLMFYVKGFIGVGSGAALVDGYVNTKRLEPSLLNAFRLRYFLDRTFNWYVGGFYASPPMIILAILGVLSFLDYNDRYNRLLLNWMLVASAMLFVDFPWQSRFLYLTPFNIYVALGILFGAEQLSRFFESKSQKHIATLAFWIFYALTILFLLNYAVRCVTIKQFGPTGLTTAP